MELPWVILFWLSNVYKCWCICVFSRKIFEWLQYIPTKCDDLKDSRKLWWHSAPSSATWSDQVHQKSCNLHLLGRCSLRSHLSHLSQLSLYCLGGIAGPHGGSSATTSWDGRWLFQLNASLAWQCLTQNFVFCFPVVLWSSFGRLWSILVSLFSTYQQVIDCQLPKVSYSIGYLSVTTR